MRILSAVHTVVKKVVTKKPLTNEKLINKMMKNPSKFFKKYNVEMTGEFKDKDAFISLLENFKNAKKDAKKNLFKIKVELIVLKILEPIKKLVKKVKSLFRN